MELLQVLKLLEVLDCVVGTEAFQVQEIVEVLELLERLELLSVPAILELLWMVGRLEVRDWLVAHADAMRDLGGDGGRLVAHPSRKEREQGRRKRGSAQREE